MHIEDPAKHGIRARLRLRDAALSTSGDYENHFVHEGRRYGHILNPRTGLPIQAVAACTVIAPTCMESDAWATACFIYGVERSLAEFNPPLQMRFLLRGDSGTNDFAVRQPADFPVMK